MGIVADSRLQKMSQQLLTNLVLDVTFPTAGGTSPFSESLPLGIYLFDGKVPGRVWILTVRARVWLF